MKGKTLFSGSWNLASLSRVLSPKNHQCILLTASSTVWQDFSCRLSSKSVCCLSTVETTIKTRNGIEPLCLSVGQPDPKRCSSLFVSSIVFTLLPSLYDHFYYKRKGGCCLWLGLHSGIIGSVTVAYRFQSGSQSMTAWTQGSFSMIPDPSVWVALLRPHHPDSRLEIIPNLHPRNLGKKPAESLGISYPYLKTGPLLVALTTSVTMIVGGLPFPRSYCSNLVRKHYGEQFEIKPKLMVALVGATQFYLAISSRVLIRP